MNIDELRSCIRMEFDMEAATEKLVIKGITYTNRLGHDIWELLKVNDSVAWS